MGDLKINNEKNHGVDFLDLYGALTGIEVWGLVEKSIKNSMDKEKYSTVYINHLWIPVQNSSDKSNFPGKNSIPSEIYVSFRAYGYKNKEDEFLLEIFNSFSFKCHDIETKIRLTKMRRGRVVKNPVLD